MTARKKILFGVKDQWEPAIRARLDAERYDCTFGNFLTTDFMDFDLVAPLTLEDYAGLEVQRDAARGRALFPGAQAVALCHDKLRFNRLIAASAFSWTIPPLLDKAAARPPFIMKRREDVFGAHSHLVATEADRERLAGFMRRPDVFAQTYVPGDREFATHILVRDGRPAFHLNVVYEMESDFYVKSRQFKQKSNTLDNDVRELDLFVEILDLIGYRNGTCCFNYKYRQDEVQIFEVNPRYGGSLNQGINDYLRAYERAVIAA